MGAKLQSTLILFGKLLEGGDVYVILNRRGEMGYIMGPGESLADKVNSSVE